LPSGLHLYKLYTTVVPEYQTILDFAEARDDRVGDDDNIILRHAKLQSDHHHLFFLITGWMPFLLPN